VSITAALTGGVVGTLVLTTILTAASELRLTRIDLPFLLGTALTPKRTRARAFGFALHFIAGVLFALGYYVVFVVVGRAGWALGMALGVLHAAFAGTALVNIILPAVHPRMGTFFDAANSQAVLELPGFMLLNYGRATPLVTLLSHLLYGAIVGAFIGAGGH
jgi:hypothetical protein